MKLTLLEGKNYKPIHGEHLAIMYCATNFGVKSLPSIGYYRCEVFYAGLDDSRYSHGVHTGNDICYNGQDELPFFEHLILEDSVFVLGFKKYNNYEKTYALINIHNSMEQLSPDDLKEGRYGIVNLETFLENYNG